MPSTDLIALCKAMCCTVYNKSGFLSLQKNFSDCPTMVNCWEEAEEEVS